MTRPASRFGSAALAASLIGVSIATAGYAHADASSQWPLQYLKADQDWNISKGSGVTVAVVDTGVASIADTQNSLLPGADFSVGTTSSGNGESDLDGHGTAMAALIAGAGHVVSGLAPDAKLLPVRATTGESMTPDALAAAIQYAISAHASVISISLRVIPQNTTLANAIQAAIGDNIVVVAASGDESQASVDYPAAYPGVVAVGAIAQSGAAWSSSNTGPQVALAAPGVSVPTEDSYGTAATTDGTSASTAYVSATVALIRAAHPSWTAGQVIRDLIATADPGSGESAGEHSDQYGYGIINPLRALQATAPSETSNPLLSSSTGPTTSAAPTTAETTASPGVASPTTRSRSGLVIGIVVAVVVIIAIIMLILVLSRRNKSRRGGGPGSGGLIGTQSPYAQNPQQNPYQQPAQGPSQQDPYGPQQQYPYPPQQPPQR